MADYFDREKFTDEMNQVSLTQNQKEILLDKMREFDANPNNSPQKSKSNYVVWIKSLAAALVVALLFGGIYYFSDNRQSGSIDNGEHAESDNAFMFKVSAAEEIPQSADPVKFICNDSVSNNFGPEFSENSDNADKYLLFSFCSDLQIEGTGIASVDFSADEKGFLFDFEPQNMAEDEYQTYVDYIENNVVVDKQINNGIFKTSAEYLKDDSWDHFTEKLCDSFTFIAPENDGERQSLSIGNILKFIVEIPTDGENSFTKDVVAAYKEYDELMYQKSESFTWEELKPVLEKLDRPIVDYLNEMFKNTQVDITVTYNDGTTQQQSIVPSAWFNRESTCVDIYWELV